MSILLSDGLAAVMDGHIINTVRGDVLIFRPDEIHFGRFLRAGEHRYLDIYLPVSCFPQKIDPLLKPFSDSSPQRSNRLRPENEEKEWLLSSVEEMVRIIATDAPVNETVLFSYVITILARCGTWYDKSSPESSDTPASLEKALKFINANYNEQISLDIIASETGCSVTYLTGMFRRYTGKTVWGYITECRMRTAERALRGGASVTEACYRAGFGDCSGFIKTFKKIHGCTPRRYAENGCFLQSRET